MPNRLSILIAEDSAADRMLLSTIVSRQGHRVLTASNGLEAVGLFEQERPQLVLMDALMPVMDGFEAARRIRRAEQGGREVPIIAVSAHATHAMFEQCLDAGIDDCLAKPLTRQSLAAALLRWIELQPANA